MMMPKSFLPDRRGGTALIFAFMIIPICMAVGVAVDYSRLAHARQILQDNADAAVLAGATVYIDDYNHDKAVLVTTGTYSAATLPAWIVPTAPAPSAQPVHLGSGTTIQGCAGAVGNPGYYDVSLTATAHVDLTIMSMFTAITGGDNIKVRAEARNPLAVVSICDSTFGTDAEDWNTAYLYKIPQYSDDNPSPGGTLNPNIGWNWQYLPTKADLYELGGNCGAPNSSGNADPRDNSGNEQDPYNLKVKAAGISRRCIKQHGTPQSAAPAATSIILPATQPFGMALEVQTAGNDGAYADFVKAAGHAYFDPCKNAAFTKTGVIPPTEMLLAPNPCPLAFAQYPKQEMSDQDYPFGYTGQYNQAAGDITWFYSGLISASTSDYAGMAPDFYIDNGMDSKNKLSNKTVFGGSNYPSQVSNGTTKLRYPPFANTSQTPVTPTYPGNVLGVPYLAGSTPVSFAKIQIEDLYVSNNATGGKNCSVQAFYQGMNNTAGEDTTGMVTQKCMNPNETVGGWMMNLSCAKRQGATIRYMWNDMGSRWSGLAAIGDDFNYQDLTYNVTCFAAGNAFRVHLVDPDLTP